MQSKVEVIWMIWICRRNDSDTCF